MFSTIQCCIVRADSLRVNALIPLVSLGMETSLCRQSKQNPTLFELL